MSLALFKRGGLGALSGTSMGASKARDSSGDRVVEVTSTRPDCPEAPVQDESRDTNRTTQGNTCRKPTLLRSPGAVMPETILGFLKSLIIPYKS